MKTCTKCGVEKHLFDFSKRKRIKSGYRSWCKFCCNEAEQNRLLNTDIKAKKRDKTAIWVSQNPDRVKFNRKNHVESLENRAAREARRRAKKANATPHWLNEVHQMQIRWFYMAAKMMSETSGIEYEVDHIHPLRGENFTGLHVPWNLQCIPAIENLKKSNKLVEEPSYVWR